MPRVTHFVRKFAKVVLAEEKAQNPRNELQAERGKGFRARLFGG